VKRPLRRVAVEGAGKVNLGLRVGPRRDDGYHDVEGLLQTIDIADRLEITTVDGADLVSVAVPGHPDLDGPENLAAIAARRLAGAMKAGGANGGPTAVRIEISKRLPVAAGLAGGSADAAAALVGLNALWGAGLPARDLVQLGASIGSDVPALLVGGLVRIGGRGERVQRAGEPADTVYVLGVTAAPIAAADAYAAFDRIGGRDERASSELHNDLEAAACDLMPGLADKIGAMRDAAGVAFVSGSGPTVVGVAAPDAAAAVAEQVRPAFDDVLLTRPTTWGVRLHIGQHRGS
jgi:4-diphosphocytidyl-2-C-methyl-D-erythritol kinase